MKKVFGRFTVIWQGSLVVAMVLGAVSGANAADSAWRNAVSGSWTNAANWNNGVPNANAGLLTNTTASFTVSFDGGSGLSITNVVISNASAGNSTILNINYGSLSVTSSTSFQSTGGIVVQSNAVLNVNGAAVANSILTSVSQGGVINIGSSGVGTTYDNFESYVNGEVLASGLSSNVTGSPWGEFGVGIANNLTALTGRGVGGSVSGQLVADWSLGNNANVVFWFSSAANIAGSPGISISLFVSNPAAAVVSNTIVKAAFEEGDGSTVWQTTASAAPVLTNGTYQTFTLPLSSATMELANGSGAFSLTNVINLRLRFENASCGGGCASSVPQQIFLDNFQGVPSATWNQTAGSFNIGDAGNGTMVIAAGGLLMGQANIPSIGHNITLASASNGVGQLYIEGGTYLWPGRNGSANPMYVGRGQIGIVTVSNGWFTLSAAQATNNGLRVGYGDSTANARGLGTLQMFGGVVTNAGYLQVGTGNGISSQFASGTISVSAGTFYQVGINGSVRLGYTNLDNAYLVVGGTGTFISTNTVNAGWHNGGVGTVQVSGNGQLVVTNLVSDPAQIVLSGLGGTGILNLSGGTTVADQLIATNGANSIVNFGSGEFFINYLTEVSNGVTFVVGDGTNAATLVLLGGTHYFNNGLSVAKNSTLAGTAVIVAEPVTIAAGGILSPGVQVGTLTISNDLAVSGGVLDYFLGTNSSQAIVTGNLTLGGTLNITDAGGFGTGVYTLVTYPVGSNFVYSGVTIGSVPNPSLFYTVDTSIPGLVNLNVTATSPSTSFAAWQLQYFGSTNCAACGGNADFDGNGMSNTNKFLAGFNPTNNVAYPHIIMDV